MLIDFRRATRSLALAFSVLTPFAAAAQTAPPPAEEQEAIIVYGRAIDQIGVARAASDGTVGYADFENRPLGRVGELAETVPGLIATQHSGTGKANQFFLRGFNLDHGTDFAAFVDDVPINMRSHGHGQGYLDLNFLIPELVERVDYRKGPYHADVGDFSAAGTVKFQTVDTLARPFVQATAGMFDYYRGLAAGSFAVGEGDLLIGVDGTSSNGPWELDEDLEKINALIKYSRGTAERGFSIDLSAYRATWASTDQVPERAVASGLIGRYGNIDPTLGGETTRIALSGQGRFGATKVSAYGLYYKMRLTSNFTYFLDDDLDGDQFQQRDERGVFGGAIRHEIDTALGGVPLKLRVGGDARYDAIGAVGLFRSTGGRITTPVRTDSVDEYSGALWAEGEFALTSRLRAILGVRGDLLGWNVRAGLPINSGDGSDFLAAPKAALAWRATDHLELYANYGESFHSNDVRGATIKIDPASGDPADPVGAMARARGAETGFRVEYPRFNATVSGFFLDLESELVFVGDAGTTEPNDATRRYGVEATAFWRPADWLTIDAALTATHARFRDAPGFDRIPGSVAEVVAAGASAQITPDIALTARVRHFGPAPLIEDNSVRSDATTLVNLGAYWRIGPAKLALDLLNLFDTRDSDITYFYESRLAGEPDPVADRHFHPVEPRQLRASLRVGF